MKKISTLIAVLAFLSVSYAQTSNAILFTEQGEQFYVVLNGVKQNAKPETNVKVSDLNAANYKMKIIFADATLGELDKNLMLEPGNEVSYSIKKNNKGVYVLRFISSVPVAQAPPAPQNQTVVVYGTTPPVGTTTVVQETTTTTGAAPEGVSMGLNVNDPDLGVSFNVNINAGGENTTSSSTSMTTTTTTTTTTSGGYPPPVATEVVYVPGYSGPTGCPFPISQADFAMIKNSISSKSFEDSKLTIAKQVITNKCLTCSQMKDIMLLFDFENTRLDFAKFGYAFTYDIGNYYLLNDAFDFESSIDELNNYINGGR
ncbi:MAG: DUF4476 domain-containing protein [Bacteroidetes bacterium]|nr:DUF4476 domain-containing protein [Bacteroidota bacterium]MBU1717668.1 DUF4476 domain-containing protein [Bacteroidota bacterium]